MNRLKWCVAPLGAACLLTLTLTGSFWAQDTPASDTPALSDKHAKVLRDSLKDVINTGADLFNKYGDHAGCYRLWKGALLAIKPLLAPAMQNEIDMALADAEKLPRVSDRAFALRKTIDAIRDQAGGPPAGADKKARAKKVGPPKTLWDRLGGEANVRKVVDDFTKAAAADPKVNFSRDGKYKLDEPTVKFIENQVVDFISSATGGPLKYQGKNMKDAHKGMGITNGEYAAAGLHLKKALEQNGARPQDVEILMKAVEGMRSDIVESK
jgi:hemoglobin